MSIEQVLKEADWYKKESEEAARYWATNGPMAFHQGVRWGLDNPPPVLPNTITLPRDVVEGLVQALRIAALGETQFDGIEAMHAARKALESYEAALKDGGV